MSKGNKKQFKQFSISSIEDGMLVLQGLIVPVIIDLEKFNNYAKEAEFLLEKYKPGDCIPAIEYDSVHDKLLYQQRELLRFIADHQASSFSYISLRPILIKKGFLKREMLEGSKKILNELLDIRNMSSHNAQSTKVAEMEIAKKKIPAVLAGVTELKPLLNPVVIRKVQSYSWDMLADFIAHNVIRSRQFEIILSEMKADYQSMYDNLPDAPFLMTSYGIGLTREIKYLENVVNNQRPDNAGRDIASLSMGIQKGKYDGTEESFKQWIGTKEED